MLQIDPEFKSLIPALKKEEYEQLERNLLQEGCRDPLIVWQGILIDGHNRYAICTRHGLPYRVLEHRGLHNREAVIDWMIDNQLARRNLTNEQMSYLRGLKYRRAKKKQGAPEGNENAKKQKAQNEPVESTAEQLADELKVGHATIKRDAKFSEAVDTLATNTGEEIKQAILTREIQATKKEVEQVAAMEPAQQKAVIIEAKKKKNLQKAIQEQQKQARVEKQKTSIQSLPDTIFNVLYADPPWQYQNSGFKGSAEQHYETLPTQQICTLLTDIDVQVAKQAVLFLWATNPLLPDAMQVINAWGFTYKTNFVWIKNRPIGMGFYNHGQHELLLLATRGQMPPLVKSLPSSIIEDTVKEHSRKPSQAYDLIEQLYPGCHYIELFARNTRSGWFGWGNEVNKYGHHHGSE